MGAVAAPGAAPVAAAARLAAVATVGPGPLAETAEIPAPVTPAPVLSTDDRSPTSTEALTLDTSAGTAPTEGSVMGYRPEPGEGPTTFDVSAVAPHAATRAPNAANSDRRGNAPAAVVEPDAPVVDSPIGDTADARRSASERSVRVDVDLLDALMRQVGELVLARNQVISLAGALDDANFSRTIQRLSLIVSELQEDVMKTRMQPVEQLWAKMPRVVRDLASQFGKQIELRLDGGETELDRSILEAVKDPLTHLIRNAVDHGIEAPEKRMAAGKSPTGHVALKAFHEGGQVVLEMTDDGGGIDPEKVGAKALERGLVTPAELDSLSDRQVTDMIFRPGFSTATVVTNVSGRGVGMDVVRTNIEKIGGTVDLSSTPGVQTTFRIKIPLTLAIIPALLVGCSGGRYAIPQACLQELVRLEPKSGELGIEHIDETMVYRLRGRLMPLVRLDQCFGLPLTSLATAKPLTSLWSRPTIRSSGSSWTRSSKPRRSWSSLWGDDSTTSPSLPA